MNDFENISLFLRNKVNLTEKEVDIFVDAIEVRKVSKKENFITQGKRAAYKGFLNKGCTRTYFTDNNGKDNVIYFSFENSWLGDIESYHLNKPSRISIQAIEVCQFFVITKDKFEHLETLIPNLSKWYNYTAVKMYSNLFDKLIENKIRNKEDKYNYLLTEHPYIFQRVPLQHIADYLEIEPQSLSRLRRRLLEK
ncbi:Crp/Fnr family transcriptional regulator [Ulvibacterium sp.]|uniref:Crp/Fnr family transcriptional regulator n=1 Tax=Ulvibacterium sp. TaxID=2665914 RepID=UPI00262EA93C|nr:Crp/Fnr family transcriptional regulator [Ulvibacterium sp.]